MRKTAMAIMILLRLEGFSPMFSSGIYAGVAFLIGLSGGVSGSVSVTPISGCTSINRRGGLA